MPTAHNALSFIANRLYLAGLFLLPTAVVVSFTVPLIPLKMVIATVALVGALILTILGAFKRGALSIPLSLILGAAWLLPISYAVAGLLGPSFMWSVVGAGLDMDTVFYMSLIALSVSLPFAVFEKRSDFMRALFVLLVASWIIGLFHLIRLFFGAEVLSFGIMGNPLFSPVGKWNDVAIFFGLMGLVSLVALESMHLKVVERYAVVGTLVVSLFFVAVVNFVPVWVALGVLALGMVLYKFLLAPRESTKFSSAATIVFVVAVVAVVFTSSLGASLGRTFGVEQIEARPSWGSTLEIAKHSVGQDALTGVGPNLFLLEWDKSRPELINQSIFWNADFTSGVGMIPSIPVTAGAVGSVAWILFIVLFLMAGVRGLMLRAPQDEQSFNLMMITFTGALYMLAMATFYLPSAQLALIGFALLGMFAALYHHESGAKSFDVDFRERPRIGFVVVLALALTLVASALTLYGTGTVFASARAYEQAARAAQVDGDLDRAIGYLNTSIGLFPTDQSYRLGALIHLAKLNQIINTTTNTPSAETQQAFQEELGAAVESGLAAVRYNEQNYRNWAALGATYQSVVPLNVDGSYEAAVNAFTKARELNPSMPTLAMSLAQIEIAKGKPETAKQYVEEAVALKRDYTQALTLLAQLELEGGNIKKAIERAESASVFEPSNPVMHFQVGVLKFEDKDFQGAGEAFTRAVELAPDYANARYFLGRTYISIKDFEKALVEFKEVLRLNPESADVQGVITALEAGTDPFAPDPKKK